MICPICGKTITSDNIQQHADEATAVAVEAGKSVKWDAPRLSPLASKVRHGERML